MLPHHHCPTDFWHGPSTKRTCGALRFGKPGPLVLEESRPAARVDSVSDLKNDDDGIWRGTASQGGKSVQIAVDYKGNVVTTAQQ